MINKCENTPSFGWRYPMHKTILREAASQINFDKPVVLNKLEKAVQMPDLDEFNMFGQKHFYFPKDSIKSFLDYSGKMNAKYAYRKHLLDFKKNLNESMPMQALEEAGRALHYLQDVTQPNHVQGGSAIGKVLDAKSHKNFENFAYENQDEFISFSEPAKISACDFYELFHNTVNISLKNNVPSRSNKQNWHDIAQDGIDLAIGATRKFLEIMQNLM